MAMVDIVSSLLQAGPWLKSVGLIQKSVATWCCSAFIAWTGWTVTVTVSHDDSTINVVLAVIIIIITITIAEFSQHIRALWLFWQTLTAVDWLLSKFFSNIFCYPATSHPLSGFFSEHREQGDVYSASRHDHFSDGNFSFEVQKKCMMDIGQWVWMTC